MRISFVVNPVYGGWSAKDDFLSGTEESVVEWASWLQKMGHEVMVFHNGHDDHLAYTHRKVEYYPRYLYEPGLSDVCVNVKSYDIAPVEPTIYLTNETNAPKHDLSAYNMVVWPSQWAVDNYEVNNNNVKVLPHGYNPNRIYPLPKTPLSCLYASSPDRGLDTLERIWPMVVEQFPEAHLTVTYNGHINAPNVTTGIFTEKEISELYNRSEFWLYPMGEEAIELYCMTGKKAQAAGCIPVVIPRMALEETVQHGFLAYDEIDFYDQLIQALSLSKQTKRVMAKDVAKMSGAVTWEKSTKMLLDLLQQIK